MDLSNHENYSFRSLTQRNLHFFNGLLTPASMEIPVSLTWLMTKWFLLKTDQKKVSCMHPWTETFQPYEHVKRKENLQGIKEG